MAQLSLYHTMAEGWIMRQLVGSDITLKQGVICSNALLILSILRCDVSLSSRLLTALISGSSSSKLIHLLCSSLHIISQSSQSIHLLLKILQESIDHVKDDKMRIEIQSICVSFIISNGSPFNDISSFISSIHKENQKVFQSLLICNSYQFPLPSFTISSLNSLSEREKDSLYIRRESCLISSSSYHGRIVCRSRLSRHTWSFEPLPSIRNTSNHVSNWLNKLGMKKKEKSPSMILGTMGDGFDLLKGPRSNDIVIDSSSLLNIMKRGRKVRRVDDSIKESKKEEMNDNRLKIDEWRGMSLSMGYMNDLIKTPSHFSRNIKHMDQSIWRETHKIGVVYVGLGQEDKNSILSNRKGSDAFESFVNELGWEMKIGEEGVYSGGLPSNSNTLYYADSYCECVFHVSTRLQGDVSQKMKHIGNDEIHIVWNENCRPYRRHTLATQFCDVLFVIDRISPSSLKIRIETQSHLDLSPLWNGIVIPEEEAATFIRTASLNASRSYRLSRDTIRPFEHCNNVFDDEIRPLSRLSLRESICSLFIPCMTQSS